MRTPYVLVAIAPLVMPLPAFAWCGNLGANQFCDSGSMRTEPDPSVLWAQRYNEEQRRLSDQDRFQAEIRRIERDRYLGR